METFSVLLALCAENSPAPGEFPSQRPVTQSFDVLFDLRLNKRWVNNREAGDLRRHCVHYDAIVMQHFEIYYGYAAILFCAWNLNFVLNLRHITINFFCL